MQNIRLLAFDADDTLWDCQSYFESVEKEYCKILAPFASEEDVSKALFAVETANMPSLGYGCKAFVLSLIENAVEVSGGKISAHDIARILDLGKTLLELPGNPLPGVEHTLAELKASNAFKMVVFTKGELLDQENKLERSGLKRYFDDVVIVSDKTPDAYQRLCTRFGVDMHEFMMVGNSFRSDIEPVLKLGGYAIHIPFHTVWQHEVVEEYDHNHLIKVRNISEILQNLALQHRDIGTE